MILELNVKVIAVFDVWCALKVVVGAITLKLTLETGVVLNCRRDPRHAP